MNDGFTLIELIIGGAVSLLVISVTLGLVVEQRRLFLGDQQSIDYNQNLRAASDFIGTDIKQVGERVEASSPIPVVTLVAGSGSDPDALILQRKLLEEKLVICDDISTGDTEIVIADSALGCNYDDGDTDNLTDNLGEFKRYRCKLETNPSCTRGDDDTTDEAIAALSDCDNECVYTYIYDPANNRGEFFLYTDEIYETNIGATETKNKLKIIPLGTSNQLTYSYSKTSNPNDGPVIYILEEKKYGLCDGVLQLTVNRRPAYGDDCPYPTSSPQPVRLVDGIDDLQVRVQTSGGWVTTFNEDLANITDFTEIESIELSLETEANERISTNSKTLTLSTKFFPRNTKSSF